MKMRPKLVQRKGLFRHDGFCTEFFFFGHGGWLKLSWQVVKNVRGSMAEKQVFAFLVPWKALHVRLREHVGRMNVHVEMETYVKPTNSPMRAYRESIASTNSFFRREKPPLPHIRGVLPQNLFVKNGMKT